MTDERRQERSLDAALDGDTADERTQPLVDTADQIKRSLAVDVPPAGRQRALFLSGVAARDRRFFSPARTLIPAFAIAIIVFAAFAGQSSPGRGPLRDALNAVGIGQSPSEELDEHLFRIAGTLREADDALDRNPVKARNLAIESLERLGSARALVGELDGERAEDKLDQIEDFEDDAVDILVDAAKEQEDALEESRDEDDDPGQGDDDGDSSSGEGSGTSDSDDDSGSGSDDSGSDDSGSGSGQADADDNSGSGSDDSDGDDNSGPGSGGSDDNSGSGSDDSSGGDSN